MTRRFPLGSIRGHNETGSDVWKRMLGDEGEQQEENWYHGDEDALQDPRSVEMGSHNNMQNEEICRILQLALIEEVMNADSFRWFGHVPD